MYFFLMFNFLPFESELFLLCVNKTECESFSQMLRYRVVGGLIILFYRFIYLFCDDWIKWKMERERLLCLLLTLSITIPGVLTVGYAMGNGPVSRKQAMWIFCIGKSEEPSSVLHDYGILCGNISFEPEHLPRLILFFCLICVVIELAC